MNKKYLLLKLAIFLLCFALAIVLYLNRFGFSLNVMVNNVKQECILRHPFEHFIWGFFLPIISCIILGLFSWFKFNWKWFHLFGVIVVICVAVVRIFDNGIIQLFYSLFDVMGLIFSYSYLKWILTDK